MIFPTKTSKKRYEQYRLFERKEARTTIYAAVYGSAYKGSPHDTTFGKEGPRSNPNRKHSPHHSWEDAKRLIKQYVAAADFPLPKLAQIVHDFNRLSAGAAKIDLLEVMS